MRGDKVIIGCTKIELKQGKRCICPVHKKIEREGEGERYLLSTSIPISKSTISLIS